MSGHDAPELPLEIDTDLTRHDATRPDVSDAENSTPSNSDKSGHFPTRPDKSEPPQSQKGSETQPVMSRHGATDYDIFEHPYVKRLEGQVEKWEGKYQEQVRRTEEIQLKSTQQILELQRMTAIGQSQTLADFMLKAKEWVLGDGVPRPEKSSATDAPTA